MIVESNLIRTPTIAGVVLLGLVNLMCALALTYALAHALRSDDSPEVVQPSVQLNPEAKLDRLKKAVEANPGNYGVHFRLGHALAEVDRFEEAKAVWDGYIERHPDNVQAYAQRGGVLLRMRLYDSARQDFKHACDQGDKQSCWFLDRSNVLLPQGDLEPPSP